MEVLEKRILLGDQEAFKEWMDMHIRKIESFAIQCGLSPKEAGKVTETVFRDIFHSLGELTQEQLEERNLIKSVLHELTGLTLADSPEALFPFEEDNELHRKIISLPYEVKVPFILAQFHHKSISEIATIMDQTEQQAAHSIEEALMTIDESNLEKKLKFLNISYERLMPTFEESNIFKQDHQETPPVQEDRTKVVKRKPIILWSIGGVILIALLFISVIRSDAYQRSSSEKFIGNLKTSFQQELDDRFALIGLTQPDENEGYRFLEIYANEPKEAFHRFIVKLEEQIAKDTKIDRKAATQKYETLIQQLRLPSEMMEDLLDNPKTENREESIRFLDELYMKINYLMTFYIEVLAVNEEVIWSSELNEDGIVDLESFLAKKSNYPIELQKAIDGMATQSFYLTGLKDVAPLFPQYGTPEVLEMLQQNLHPDMKIYVYMLSGESARVSYGGTIEEKMDALSYIEQELPKTKKSDELHHYLDSGYMWLFFTVTGVYEQGGIYDQNLSIKPEIRERWKRIASRDEDNIVVQIMREMVKKLEEQNWMALMEYEVEKSLSEKLDTKIKQAREGNN
ncbi:hypothetical protein AB1K89_06780 [Sporosarcina sp. 179-K 8C2 HS]|uniref:hypothetical protein n=1 Tax=Sporosarcina sp. 179-K 8C2 HS TaxID=3142387 RepID=UPI0039A00533